MAGIEMSSFPLEGFVAAVVVAVAAFIVLVALIASIALSSYRRIIMKEEEDKTMTYGEKAVGLSFNPSADPDVDRIKKLYAEIIDFCDDGRQKSGSPDQVRLFSVAITEAQTAQMWAVKAITFK